MEAPGKAEGSRLDVSPTEIGAVPQPNGRRAQRGSNRRDSARRRRSHTRHHFAPPPRWQPRCRPPGTAQPSPARPGPPAAGRALPARRLRGSGPGRCWVRRRAVPLGALSLVLEDGADVSCALLWQICEVSQH